ncbi:hypothetical protein GWI33_000842 [Rhynchophorus ferrugineus]|uniref:Uncharacterized protein n=1 Tax=Rhynchophorus ferrugineus TaxID=354439 RepID=A0A834ILM7_RHYFE|nr:hypothetical protein GWI33_000842 [Rhynchophorus ferrugineus]
MTRVDALDRLKRKSFGIRRTPPGRWCESPEWRLSTGFAGTQTGGSPPPRPPRGPASIFFVEKSEKLSYQNLKILPCRVDKLQQYKKEDTFLSHHTAGAPAAKNYRERLYDWRRDPKAD